MYHGTMHIFILCRNAVIEQAVRQALPLERFSHCVEVGDLAHGQALENAEVVLTALSAQTTLQAIRARCQPGAMLVVCDTAEKLATLDTAELDAADEFWEAPMTPALAARRFGRIQSEWKRRRELVLAQCYLDTAIDSIPDMVWFKDINGIHIKVNKAFCNVVNKPKEEIAGKSHPYVWDIPEEEYKKGEYVCKETDMSVIKARKGSMSMEKVKTQSGMRQFKTYKSPLFDTNGEVMGTVGIAHDVTDLENIGTELEIILGSIPFAILVRNRRGLVVNANKRFEQYFGIQRDQILGRRYNQWQTETFTGEATWNQEGYLEAVIQPPNQASPKTMEIHEAPIYDMFHSAVGMFYIYRDVTVERALEQRVLHNMNTDFLTGLFNRRYFYQYIAANRGERSLSLLYVDLDQFKEVNDTYGHGMGDEALVITAQLLQECFADTFIARLGGDEFMIAILDECDKTRLGEMAELLFSRMRQVFGTLPQLEKLSASIGIASTRNPNVDVDTLMHQSDTALYKAKEEGRARYCFFEEESM